MVNKKRSGKFYRRNEAEVMQRFGLTPTKNSGAGWLEKEDGYNDFILSQLKSTDAESIRLTLLDIHKLEYHAITEHKLPVFMVQFLQTNEVFVLVKPADLPSVAQYLECGKCDIIQNENLVALEQQEVKQTKIIRSGGREDFWADKEKERQNGRNKNKGTGQI